MSTVVSALCNCGRYEKLVSYWIGEKYTLRYTGGMVPDVFQIIVKEKGVFSNVTSPSTKAKLRILFEVAPLGLLVRAICDVGFTSCCCCCRSWPCVHIADMRGRKTCLLASQRFLRDLRKLRRHGCGACSFCKWFVPTCKR